MADTLMPLNANTYAWASSASESDITLTEADRINTSTCIVFNNTLYPVTVTSGLVAGTAAFPTSATVPVACTVIAAGEKGSYTKPAGHGVISMISSAADAGKYVYFQVGTGE